MNSRTLFFALSLLMVSFQIKAQHSDSDMKSKSHVKTVSIQTPTDIVDIAASSEDFSTLVAAVKAAGLVETLKSDGPFTVFAPVNSAFSKLPEGTVASLLKPEAKTQLTKVLTYHVVSGALYAADIIKAINNSGGTLVVKTVSGDELTAMIVDGGVILKDENGGESAVSKTDIKASNGVIHVLDSVLLPK